MIEYGPYPTNLLIISTTSLINRIGNIYITEKQFYSQIYYDKNIYPIEIEYLLFISIDKDKPYIDFYYLECINRWIPLSSKNIPQNKIYLTISDIYDPNSDIDKSLVNHIIFLEKSYQTPKFTSKYIYPKIYKSNYHLPFNCNIYILGIDNDFLLENNYNDGKHVRIDNMILVSLDFKRPYISFLYCEEINKYVPISDRNYHGDSLSSINDIYIDQRDKNLVSHINSIKRNTYIDNICNKFNIIL